MEVNIGGVVVDDRVWMSSPHFVSMSGVMAVLGYRRSRRGRLINIVVGFEGMFIAEDIVVLIFVVDEYVRTILMKVVTYVMSRWR